ncbi:unnamed protein product [Bursaphelenchus xylophilus]|uniref:(pine wood nematode) hypothetical protein n=1 Tax=Bursaphelenchus xylophilus TaxID=6326 RepID=A0A7I8WIQ7_BURXY|nr:unnamed protein product [Bursaphelenchus xylophilus]CAG9108815.1 unnamed protein product [Bursaphelenchus xylophilus]
MLAVNVTATDKSCGGREEDLVYTIQQRPHDLPAFRLEPHSGELCLLKDLDFEQQQSFQLTVLASSQNQKTATALVNVYVQDLNDNFPEFAPLHYYTFISKELKANTTWPLLQVNAYDKDNGEFGELVYSLVDSMERAFKLDPNTGMLYYAKELGQNIWKKKYLELKVIATDGGRLQSKESAIIHITLNDSKYCPSFSQRIYEFEVTEDILPGIAFGVLKAEGASIVNIKASDDKEPDYFHLEPSSGRLSVLRDISEKEVYYLTIEAISSAGCSGYAQVKVVVEDVNNHTPEFDADHLEVTIPENYPIHTNFFSVRAHDKDRNENGRVTYELMSSHPPCPIIVQPLTGQTILAAPLDYETVKQYELVIRAQDQGIPALSASINITLKVLDVNDNPPEFKSNLYKAEIAENTAVMTTVLKVEASDKDSGSNGKIKYRIVNKMPSAFEINALTGEIFLKKAIDREQHADYSFVVLVADMGTPSLEANASVHIKVLDINDNSPNCSTIKPLEIKENEIRNIIGKIEAKDPDYGPNGTVTYRIQRHNEYFDVKDSGHVTLKKRLPSNLEGYGIFVIAEDHGPLPRAVVCQVRINVVKEISHVVILDPVDSLIKLDPACGVGCQLARINVSNVQRWELQNSHISQYFKIEDGVLKIDKNIEDENLFVTPQQVVVNMFDQQNNRKQLSFTIKKWLRVVNHEHTNTIRVSERLLPGTKVVSGGGTLEHCYYTLEQSMRETFDLNPITGDVYLTTRLNYTEMPSYSLKLTRHNILTPDLLQSTLIVDVEDENLHSPRFSQPSYLFSVMEDISIGSVIGRVYASHQDDNKTLTFRIIGENDYFTVDESNGEIYVKSGLDFIKDPRHHLVVEVLDTPSNLGNRRNNKCIVIVEVTDTNNHAPLFVSAQNTTLILDPMISSVPFHYFVATDGDSGDFGKVRYSIVHGNKPQFFNLNPETGELSVIHRPDSSIKLTVRAADLDPISPRYVDQIFSIDVKQSDSQWFFFSKSVNEVTVTPEMKKGAILLDFGRKIKSNSLFFKLIPQTEKNFVIDELSGVLALNTDQFIQKSHSLAVYVLDKITNKSDTTSVVIRTPSPSNGPKISALTCGQISVIENRDFDVLTKVVATINGDSSEEIRYSIVGGSGGSHFKIDEVTGVISATRLDREIQDEHILVVSASDQQTPKRVDVCTITIHVLDENDNAPNFLKNSSIIFTISDKHMPGAIIGRVEATDLDSDLNGKVWYKLSTDESGMLDIMPQTGEIVFARNLPFTSLGWEATVIAEDLGISKTMHSTETITIKWERKSIKIDEIDEVQFLRHNYTATVMEGLPKGTFVTQLESTDTFMPINKVTYGIISGNHDTAFAIDELGVLKTAQVLDSEIRPFYVLKLVAKGNFRVLPECFVTIRVINVNDNSPMFSPPLSQHIEEDLPIGSLVMSVRARDADPDSFLEYALSPPTEFFHLNRITGEILLLKELDYETQTEHVLNIHAYDGEHTVFTEFTIKLIDVNDNAPKFTNDLFEFNVGEDTRQGSAIGRISAMDADSEEFGRLHYSIIESQSLIALDGDSGIVTLIKPLRKMETVFMTVQARDFGSPPLLSLSTIRLSGAPRTNRNPPKFQKNESKFMVSEDFPLYLPFGHIPVSQDSNTLLEFNIISVDGQPLPFKILPNGNICLTKALDYEKKKSFNAEISVKNAFEPENSRNTALSKSNLYISVADANDNDPVIDEKSKNIVVHVNERIEKGTVVAKIEANDKDDADNSKLGFYILAGNDPPMFSINQTSGDLIFEKWYDERFLESGSSSDLQESLSVIVTDNGANKRWIATDVKIVLSFDDWSGSGPIFPVPFYKVFVPEATSKGSTLLRVKPVNRLGLHDDSWRYEIINNDEIFSINETTGSIYLSGELDYELHNEYEFVVIAKDQRQRSAKIPVYIAVFGVDENAPIFTMPFYEFYVSWTTLVGQEIGRVEAVDADKGIHSKVVYSLDDKLVKSIVIDPNSGILTLKEPLARLNNHSVEEITVIASSSPLQFSKSKITLHFMDSTDVLYSIQNSLPHLNRLILGIGASFVFLIIVLLSVMLYRFCRKRSIMNNPKRHVYSVAKGNVAMMANVNRLSPNYLRSVNSTAHTTISQPCSIKSYEAEDTTTRIDNEYIRTEEGMTRSQMDSGIDPDSLSIVSGVTDYLSHVMTRTSFTLNASNDPTVNQILNATLQDTSFEKEPVLGTVRPTISLARPSSIRKQLNFNFPDLPNFNEILQEDGGRRWAKKKKTELLSGDAQCLARMPKYVAQAASIAFSSFFSFSTLWTPKTRQDDFRGPKPGLKRNLDRRPTSLPLPQPEAKRFGQDRPPVLFKTRPCSFLRTVVCLI